MIILNILGKVLAWVLKNVALVVGIIEAVAKVIAGIVSITPTKSDDWLIPWVDKIASWVKKGLYTLSDKLAGKAITADTTIKNS
jgi:hypothetical protein